jgi:hypothetical protein
MHDHHEHSHSAQTKDETLAMLKYMLHHNEHHAEEMHDLGHNLEHLGFNEAAGKVFESVAEYKKGNEILAAALAALE